MADKIKLEKVRISYPNLFVPKGFQGSEENKKYSASFVISNEDTNQIQKVKKAVLACAEEKFGKGKVPKNIKPPYTDGNETDNPDYQDCFILRASNSESKRPIVIDQARCALSQGDNAILPGYYVNAIVTFWAQDNAYGKRINANLVAVQLVSEAETFGDGIQIDIETDFDVLSDEDVSEIDNILL